MEMQGKHFENCRACNTIFYSELGLTYYCPTCAPSEEELFRQVRDYLYSNPRSNAKQINEAIGVPVPKILEYVRDGRIESLPS